MTKRFSLVLIVCALSAVSAQVGPDDAAAARVKAVEAITAGIERAKAADATKVRPASSGAVPETPFSRMQAEIVNLRREVDALHARLDRIDPAGRGR